MARSMSTGPNVDRIERVLERRRSNAAGPHANRRRPRGGRNGQKAALRREVKW
jgi:hypothetical protein